MTSIDTGQDRPLPGAVKFDALPPWLFHLRPEVNGALVAWQAGGSVSSALAGARSAPAGADGGPCFVPQHDLPAGDSYDAFIHRSGQVPTRNNLHDLFNGLIWLAMPALKRRLNALHAAEIAQCYVGAVRGPVRDALTLFDESGALLHGPPPLLQALRNLEWPALFITRRARWAEASLTIVGHALLEKLATDPRRALTAHMLLADPLALDAAGWAGKPFAPLSVLGVPAGGRPMSCRISTTARPFSGHAAFRLAENPQSKDSAHPCRS